MASGFFVRCNCRNRRLTGCQSRFLQAADGGKAAASALLNCAALPKGSNRMAAAIALGYPITIQIPEDDHMIMWHDIDYVTSKYTDSPHHAAVYEVALNIAFDDERIGLNCPMYQTDDHPNIRVIENGRNLLART